MCKQMTNDGSRTTCWIVNIWPDALIHYMISNPVGNVIGQFNHQVFQIVSKMACNIEETSWGRLNVRMPSYQYNDHYVKDRTVLPTVLSLTRESPGKYLANTWERQSLYWDGAQITSFVCMKATLTLATHVAFPAWGTDACIMVGQILTDGRVKAGGTIALIDVWNRA